MSSTPNEPHSPDPSTEAGGKSTDAAEERAASTADPASEQAGESPETKLAASEQKQRELHDRLLRMAAEFENWKKRAKREQDEAQNRGREALLKELLPSLDNLERALKHAAENDPLAVGVRLVEKQLLGALEKFQVTRFSSVGKPFDPSLHEAIQQVETAEHPSGTVAQEFASGYMQGQRLLRPAMVGVAKAPAGDAKMSDDGTNGVGGGEG
jgi:molecular chaperone GrpE